VPHRQQSICQNTRIIGSIATAPFAEYISMPATNVLTLDGGTIPTEWAIMDRWGTRPHGADAEIAHAFIVCPSLVFAVGIARAAGATKVIASDVNPRRLALAATWGARHHHAKTDDVREKRSTPKRT